MWFSKVPGYIFNKEKTPYLTKANELTLAQSQYELVAYGVFVGTIYAIIGLAAFLNYIENSSPLYLLWLIGSVAVIHSVFSVIKKYEVIPSYIISLAPAFIVGICFYDGVIESASFLTLTIFVCFFILSLKYGWRVTKIVVWQRYTGEFKLN